MASAFDSKELQRSGKVHATYGLYGGLPCLQIEELNPPISVKENYLRFLKGEDYEWVPDSYSDMFDIAPDFNPDNHAMGYEGGVDSIGVTWEALENGLPALVRPGNPLLDDVEDWERVNYVNPRSWPWDEEAPKYNEAIHAGGRPARAWINIALFERMIDALEFENAAIGLLMDPESSRSFLNKAVDFNLAVMECFNEYLDVDIYVFSDDWSSQLQPFFSEQVARDVLLEPLKRMVDKAHSWGKPVMLHSCGNGIAHIPVWIEAGVDVWQFQENAVDIDEALRLTEGKLIMEGYWVVPENLTTDSEIENFIIQTTLDSCMNGRVTMAFCDAAYDVPDNIRRIAYKVGRLAASGELEQYRIKKAN